MGGGGAAGVRNRERRVPATPQGPARAQGGLPAASALRTPPPPSCPHPTLPRFLPSQPTPAPRPPGGRREQRLRDGAQRGRLVGRAGATPTAPPTPGPARCAPPARPGPFILPGPQDPPPPSLGKGGGVEGASVRPRPAPPLPRGPGRGAALRAARVRRAGCSGAGLRGGGGCGSPAQLWSEPLEDPNLTEDPRPKKLRCKPEMYPF